jgi:hypothetical protein
MQNNKYFLYLFGIMKKAQLGLIELQFFFYGLLAGLVVMAVLVVLMNNGTIPFKLPLLNC